MHSAEQVDPTVEIVGVLQQIARSRSDRESVLRPSLVAEFA
jgi:hypothetical protein